MDPIHVSLTSIANRLEKLPKVLRSLLAQSVKPAGIHVFLSKEPYGLDSGCSALPRDLQILFATEPLLKLHWTDNTGSYRKLLPFCKLYPNSIVMTLDDDMIYNPKLVEKASELWNQYKCCISFNSTMFNSNEPYMTWPKIEEGLHTNSFSKGCGSVYHTSWFKDSQFFDPSHFKTLAPTADDVWFNAWRVHYKIPCYTSSFPFIKQALSSKTNLFQTNETKNDEQIHATLQYLQDLKISSECSNTYSDSQLKCQDAPLNQGENYF